MAEEGVSQWRALFPPAQWLPAYQAQWLPRALIAGVTLAAYAVPVAMTYASLSGRVASESESYGVDVPGRRVYRRTRKGILKRLNAFEAYAPYVAQPKCVKELHAMRIAAKRLRYTMQDLAPLYPDALAEPVQAARLCQTKLGDIHDGDVWIDTLPRFLEEEQARTLEYFGSTIPFEPLRAGILALLHNRQQQRAQDYQEFVMFWEQLQAQGVWEGLRQRLDAPGAAEVSAETDTADLTEDGTLAPTPQDVAHPV